jgi:hypothetical protein
VTLAARALEIAQEARESAPAKRERNRALSPDFARWSDDFKRMGTLAWVRDLETGQEWGVCFQRRHGVAVKLSPPEIRRKKR